MLGAHMFAQAPFASVEEYVPVRPGTGGGWSHRGPVTLPKPWRGNPHLPKMPKLPKPPYLYYWDQNER